MELAFWQSFTMQRDFHLAPELGQALRCDWDVVEDAPNDAELRKIQVNSIAGRWHWAIVLLNRGRDGFTSRRIQELKLSGHLLQGYHQGRAMFCGGSMRKLLTLAVLLFGLALCGCDRPEEPDPPPPHPPGRVMARWPEPSPGLFRIHHSKV